MSGAVDFLLDTSRRDRRVGVAGFCMGGGLALVLAAPAARRRQGGGAVLRPDPVARAQPDWSKLEAKVSGSTRRTTFVPPDKVHELEDMLKGLGKDVEMHIHPGTDHAFFNDERPRCTRPRRRRRRSPARSTCSARRPPNPGPSRRAAPLGWGAVPRVAFRPCRLAPVTCPAVPASRSPGRRRR